MRKALLVGIDHYPRAPLNGCVNDAARMQEMLCRNDDGSPNFSCRLLTSDTQSITRSALRHGLDELFSGKSDLALLFFAGHGTANNLGGYLVTQDVAQYDEGVSMTDVLQYANASTANEVVIVLDCCHSGHFGTSPAIDNQKALLREGVTVLSACRRDESALEVGEGGLFTSLICEALEGGAADVCGKVTVASLYAYVDEVLGPWDQRPLFKSHVSKLTSIRAAKPAVPATTLRSLPALFPYSDSLFPLNPTFEPTSGEPNSENVCVFRELQRMRAAGLVEPVQHEHMYDAAMASASCRLTALGRFYRSLAENGKL